MVINKTAIGSFSIRANVCDSPVGSVKFILNGTSIKIETTPPYAINGDSPVGYYTAWNPNLGSYTLEGRPYSGASGSGTAGVSEIVSFTVISSTPKMNDMGVDNSLELNIYPNPNNGSFVVESFNDEEANLTVRIHNTLGQMIYSSSEQHVSGKYNSVINIRQFPSGVYYVEMFWGKETGWKKMVVQ